MKATKTFLVLLMIALSGTAALAKREPVNQTAHDLAEQSDREIAGVWEGLSKGLEALKSGRKTSDINNLFVLARSSTNELARIAARIELSQSQLSAIITNEIDRQPLERTVKQELRSYVENDLQTLQAVKAIASEDSDAISELIATDEKEWVSMLNVLGRLYPDWQCMEIMQRRFSAAADALRGKIESHRAAASSNSMATTEPTHEAAEPERAPVEPSRDIEGAIIKEPPPAERINPLPERRDPPLQPVVSVPPPAPPGSPASATSDVSRSKWSEMDRQYLSLSPAAHRIAVMAGLGYADSELWHYAAQTGPFLLTSDQVIFLKARGIAEEVIQAMLERDHTLRRRW
ncbi:MAG TPA: hypothetical protein VFC44_20445 [Candidatus Saccharimonadales bacterium]|nr:hypothetical protein [Candidatus Saccharimonadales bacterium]